MSHKAILGIGAVVLLLGGALAYAKNFHSYQTHDAIWEGERIANIKYFAGCHYRPELIEATDEIFSSKWDSLSTKYEFTTQDVDVEIPSCLETWKKDGTEPGMNVDIQKLQAYQTKFLNREFSVLKK